MDSGCGMVAEPPEGWKLANGRLMTARRAAVIPGLADAGRLCLPHSAPVNSAAFVVVTIRIFAVAGITDLPQETPGDLSGRCQSEQRHAGGHGAGRYQLSSSVSAGASSQASILCWATSGLPPARIFRISRLAAGNRHWSTGLRLAELGLSLSRWYELLVAGIHFGMLTLEEGADFDSAAKFRRPAIA